MNHCSICGAALNDSTTSFCSECKHQLTGATDKDQTAHKDKRKKKHRKHKKNNVRHPPNIPRSLLLVRIPLFRLPYEGLP